MIIYTESDYLEAHLTEIASESHSWTIAIDAVPQRVTDVLRKFGSKPDPGPSSNARPSKSRNR